MEQTVAQKYAQPMFSIAQEENCEQQILDELRFVNEIFQTYPSFLRILESPVSSETEKAKIIDDTFGGKLNQYTINLLKILCDRSRISNFNEICNCYEDLYYLEHNILAVTAVTAVELSVSMEEKLKAKLAQVTGKNIILKKVIDRNILGGIMLKTESQQIDGTVKTRLNIIADRINKAIV